MRSNVLITNVLKKKMKSFNTFLTLLKRADGVEFRSVHFAGANTGWVVGAKLLVCTAPSQRR
jgi:hypothetical protein